MRRRVLRSLAVLGLLTAATLTTAGVAAADTTWSVPADPTVHATATGDDTNLPSDTTWTAPADTTWIVTPQDTTW